MSLLFRNTNILDVVGGQVLSGQDLLIEGDRIRALEATGRGLEAHQVIEGEDLLLSPGFINAHTHLGMSYFRNYADDMDLDTWLNEAIWPMEAHLDGEDIYWGSLLSLAEALRSGTTCFCDMYYEMDRVGEGAQEIGIRGLLTRGLTSGPDEEAKLEEVRDLYARYHKSAQGRIRVAPAPHAIYTCSEDFLKKTFDLARDLDGLIHIHTSETKKELEDSRAAHEGRTPINYLLDLGMGDLHTLAAHCVYMTEEEMDRVDKDKFFPLYNPSSNLKLASGFAPLKAMLDKGLSPALGTDGDSSNNNQDMLEEIHLAALVNKALNQDPKALPAIEVLRMATINGARALAWEDEIGSLDVGKKADITVFDLNSPNFTPRNNLISALCYSASSEDVKDVLVDGDFVLRNRKLVKVDLDLIRKRVAERMEALKKKAGQA
ncbi:MAG: amidohydrolase [Tissierellia bacterium]|nr:amidohydrolase [Tissierellia bacterium]